MILVTGAAGKTGRAVIRALGARGQVVRALVHRPQQAPVVIDAGAQDVVAGDMRDRAALEQALAPACAAASDITAGAAQAGNAVRAIYHICPNMSPDELSIGQAVLRAAREAELEHFVYHSVLHPQTKAMPHHWQKLRTEELIFETGLPYTILQPAAYVQNVLAYWDRIVQQGVYAVPYATEARLGMVDLEDVAEAAAIVLTEGGHAGATYELAGADVLSPVEVAAILERQLARPVRAQTVPLDVWERGARASGMGDYQVDTLLQMFRYYEHYGFWGNPQVLTWLLRRPPTTFASFVERAAKSLQLESDAANGDPR